MLYRRFEQLIDIFRDAPTAAPPDRVLPFYTYYLRRSGRALPPCWWSACSLR
jgi:hypothetical protein